jgi:hypothetical protein
MKSGAEKLNLRRKFTQRVFHGSYNKFLWMRKSETSSRKRWKRIFVLCMILIIIVSSCASNFKISQIIVVHCSLCKIFQCSLTTKHMRWFYIAVMKTQTKKRFSKDFLLNFYFLLFCSKYKRDFEKFFINVFHHKVFHFFSFQSIQSFFS